MASSHVDRTGEEQSPLPTSSGERARVRGGSRDALSWRHYPPDRDVRAASCDGSHRGAVYRATICEKVYDRLRNFVRHPSEPTVGHAELVWHYDNPRPLYPLFETKINKPLKTPFVSHVSF
ncbi:MAG TPA: hypothetical protein VFV49_03970 [Thermoanaerobaculia bacterium]|nr:hypothetical protein [Thermoanaerobaculia bacterium]